MFVSLLVFGMLTHLASPVSAQSFRNCTDLRKVYKFGVAKNVASATGTRAVVNRRVYLANTRLDRDKDGVACER